MANYYVRLKQRVVHRYGSKCKYCGEQSIDLLQLDHIKGGGSEHRRSLTQAKSLPNSSMVYRDALKVYDPAKYQILCKRCNMAKHNDSEEVFWKWIQQLIQYNPSLLAKATQ